MFNMYWNIRIVIIIIIFLTLSRKNASYRFTDFTSLPRFVNSIANDLYLLRYYKSETFPPDFYSLNMLKNFWPEVRTSTPYNMQKRGIACKINRPSGFRSKLFCFLHSDTQYHVMIKRVRKHRR